MPVTFPGDLNGRAVKTSGASSPMRPDSMVHACIVRPSKAGDSLPAIMYFHGGVWVLGDAHTHDRLIREISVGTGLPEALVITAENDPLRDEGEAYARKLSAAGTGVAATRYMGAIHDFLMLNALADSPPTRCAIEQIAARARISLE